MPLSIFLCCGCVAASFGRVGDVVSRCLWVELWMEVVESETTCIVLLCCGQGEQLRMAAHARLAVCRLKQYLPSMDYIPALHLNEIRPQ